MYRVEDVWVDFTDVETTSELNIRLDTAHELLNVTSDKEEEAFQYLSENII